MKQKPKKINLLMVTILGVAMFLGQAEAVEGFSCAHQNGFDTGCGWWVRQTLPCSTGGSCMINPQSATSIFVFSDCQVGNEVCGMGGCPDTGLYNGDVCFAGEEGCYDWGSLQCGSYSAYGKWDASDKKCVICNGNKEDKVCATTTWVSVTGNCSGPPDGSGTCPTDSTAKDFESACGADAACDELAEGSCVSGNGTCSETGKLGEYFDCASISKICGAGGKCVAAVGPCVPKTVADCDVDECGLYPDGCGTGGTYDCGVCAVGVGECTGDPGVCVPDSIGCCSLIGTLDYTPCVSIGDNGVGIYTEDYKVQCIGYLKSALDGVLCLEEDGTVKKEKELGNGAGEMNGGTTGKQKVGEGETNSYKCSLYSGITNCGGAGGNLVCATSAVGYSGPLSLPDPAVCSADPGCRIVAPLSHYSVVSGTCVSGVCYQCNSGYSWNNGTGDCESGSAGPPSVACSASPGCRVAAPDNSTTFAGDCPAGKVCYQCNVNHIWSGTNCVFVEPPRCDPNAWFFCNPLDDDGTGITTLVQAGETFVGYILGLIGSVALLLVIISGAMYMTSAGSEEKIATSKKILTGAVIGLGIALLAYSLLAVIIQVLNM